jgi:mandelate racemase
MMHMSIPDLVIREIRVRPVVAPLPRPIRTASGDVLDTPLLLIEVLTDGGLTGRAYAFAYTPLTLRSLTQFVRDIAPELVGKSVRPRADAADVEASQAAGGAVRAADLRI